MVQPAAARDERRKHPRISGRQLVAEIRGKQYPVLDISFGGIKLSGTFTVPGGLVEIAIWPVEGDKPVIEEKAEARARVERVEGDWTAVRFNILTEALTKLISRHMGD
jgi:hypothetical protein